jgi:hypothetical protein
MDFNNAPDSYVPQSLEEALDLIGQVFFIEISVIGSGTPCVFILFCFQPAGLRVRYSSRFSWL